MKSEIGCSVKKKHIVAGVDQGTGIECDKWTVIDISNIRDSMSLTVIRKNRIVVKGKDKMRKKIVAGNWKMNMNLQDGVALAKEINEALVADKPNCDVVMKNKEEKTRDK